jgi:hypothetical protein
VRRLPIRHLELQHWPACHEVPPCIPPHRAMASAARRSVQPWDPHAAPLPFFDHQTDNAGAVPLPPISRSV